MLTVKIYINERLVAEGSAQNVSMLKDVSDYAVKVRENANPVSGRPAHSRSDHITSHRRKQSAWALVERMAQFAQGKMT